MFQNCTTLAQLNAERIKAVQTHDVVEVNNAYNRRRAEILASRVDYLKLTPVFVTPEKPVRYSGVPIAGRSASPNTIELTQAGFLY